MRNKPNTPFFPKSTSAPRSHSSEEQLDALVQVYCTFGLSEKDARRAALADADTQFMKLALAA